MLDDNILSLMLGFRALLPAMVGRGRGRMIVLGSLGGIVPMPHGAVYAAAKFAVRGFTLSMAEELRGTGVEVCLLSCGPVDSRMLRAEAAADGTIGFVNRPLPPDAVADKVVRLLECPPRESFLPRSQALAAPIAGGYASLFAALHPLIRAAGSAGKRRYRATIARANASQGA
jgi:short-subunit dehydrogenase